MNLTEKLTPLYRAAIAFFSSVAVASTTALYELNLTFFKNAFAVTLMIYALVIFTSSNLKPAKKRYGVLFFSILALLSHKSILLLLSCFVLPWIILRASWRQRFSALVAAFLVGSIFLWHFEKSGEYLRALWGSFKAPGLWWIWFSTLRWGNLELLSTILAGIVVVSFALVLRNRFEPDKKIYVDGVCLFTILALQPFQLPGANGVGYRMILLTPLLVIPLLALCLSVVPKKHWIWTPIFFLFFLQPWMTTKNLDDVFTPWSELREDVLQISKFVKPEDHLTSHHGLEFFIDDVTGIRSRSFLSDHPEKKDFRVAFVARRWIDNAEIQRVLRERALLEIGSEYILITEKDWQEISHKFELPNHWKNPDSHRPDFIYQ